MIMHIFLLIWHIHLPECSKLTNRAIVRYILWIHFKKKKLVREKKYIPILECEEKCMLFYSVYSATLCVSIKIYILRIKRQKLICVFLYIHDNHNIVLSKWNCCWLVPFHRNIFKRYVRKCISLRRNGNFPWIDQRLCDKKSQKMIYISWN